MTESLPREMDAVEIAEPGGPEVLRLTRRSLPHPGPGEVLIKVAAAGVNRADVLQRKGGYPPPSGVSDLPGLEVAGEVAALGEGVESFQLHDKVCALLGGGGYAAYCVAPAAQCLPVPQGLEPAEAAGLPEACFTVWSNVFERGALKDGESFLVHGGSSGIGTTAIQLAAAFGARVFATAGSPEKCRACESLGAERAIDYRREDFVAVIKEATGGGVDLVLDMVAGSYVPRNLEVLRPEGRLVFIAAAGGSKAEIDVRQIMTKRLQLTGSTLRPRDIPFKAAVAARLQAKVWPLLESGRVKPLLYRTFPLARAAEAHALMESSRHIGKIVLTL